LGRTIYVATLDPASVFIELIFGLGI
jgi:hypothetical protein